MYALTNKNKEILKTPEGLLVIFNDYFSVNYIRKLYFSNEETIIMEVKIELIRQVNITKIN